MHNRLIQCKKWEPPFRKVWVESWEDCALHMEEWYDTTTPEDKPWISRLQIPESLIETVLTGQKCNLRRRVAPHQYLLMMGVARLRGTLPMMPNDPEWQESNAGCAWYGAPKARKTTPQATEKTSRSTCTINCDSTSVGLRQPRPGPNIKM